MATTEEPDAVQSGLQTGLKRRHMSLIAIGGVIGAGLFVGSGVVINSTGPAALVSFLLAGVLAVLVMRMLGEMAVARPAVGAFYEYARMSLGNWAGFSIGWLYWYFWVIVVAVEAQAGAKIISSWVPSVPVWALALALMLLLTATNLISVRSYGEFEYWFASIKVFAIVAFIVLGVLWITGAWPHAHAGVANLTNNGGFSPFGVGAVLAAVVPCVGFFTGAEIVTIAAAESAEPRRAVARATNSVILRVLLFYVGSVFVVVAVSPWASAGVRDQPYVTTLGALGIPAAGTIMQVIILVAVLSALNSGLYTASRILFALTGHGDAPRGFTRVNRRGVPVRAILLATVAGYVSVAMAFFSPDGVFAFLINSYGTAALLVYLLICLSQVRMRRRLERTDPDALRLRMWGFPYVSYVTIAAMAAVIIAMAFLPSKRIEFVFSLVVLAAVLLAYLWRRRYPASAE
ncbi:MAG TPA: amino acid permease [Streptosporangiaceae bacterium]